MRENFAADGGGAICACR
ncbi:MAG TPA: hypothetical protein DGB72_02550 [Gemmatimonadetes bacterium]|nr:hypothetical protein [Gemmatimonadota bacterium]